MTWATTNHAATPPASSANSAVASPISRYSSEKAAISMRRVAPSVFSTTASWMRARLPAASAPASTSTEATSATLAAARIAVPSWPTSLLTTSSASLTRTVVTAGKARVTALRTRDSSAAVAPRSVSVASQACGAPAKALGENTMTKLMPIDSHSTCRRLAMRAVMSRPSTLTVTVSPSFSPSSLASSAEKETSGSPE